MSSAVHLPAALGSLAVWNIITVRPRIHGRYEIILMIKLLAVAISGISSALRARPRTPPPSAPRAGVWKK